MPPGTVQHRRLQSILEHLRAAEGGEDVAPAPAAASESYGFGNPRPPSSGKKGYKILTGADDGYAQHAPTVRNNELRRGVGIGTQRTRWMNRVLGEGAPGQHDAHGGYPADTRRGVVEEKEVVICGAGFGGMAAVKHLREAGITDIRVFERGAEVGGTWYWNRYPGAAVDIESTYYSYSFTDTHVRPDDGWQFSHRFSKQPELLEYAKWVSHTFDLREEMRFQTAITSAVWDHAAQRWMVTTDRGDRVTCRFVFFCNGILTDPKFSPNIRGYERFRGDSYHTSRFPRDFLSRAAGKRVGIIGTGATAVQLIPQAAKVCERVTIFQRTPPTVTPQNNGPITDQAKYRANYVATRATFNLGIDKMMEQMNTDAWNTKVMESQRKKIRKTVNDPATAEALCPYYPFGCKRPCILDNFYENFNLPNVELVDVKDQGGVKEFGKDGPVIKGKTFNVDVMVFATGFDALGGSNYTACGVEGLGGEMLHEKYHRLGRPTTMYGVHTAKFPNMYIMQGPHSPSVLSNMIHSSEVQADYVAAACMVPRVEVTEKAEMDWVTASEEVGLDRVQSKCANWYTKLGNAKLQVYTGGLAKYMNAMKVDQDTGFTSANFVKK